MTKAALATKSGKCSVIPMGWRRGQSPRRVWTEKIVVLGVFCNLGLHLNRCRCSNHFSVFFLKTLYENPCRMGCLPWKTMSLWLRVEQLQNRAPQTCYSKSEGCYDPFAVTCGSLGDVGSQALEVWYFIAVFFLFFATCCVVIFKLCLSTPQRHSRQRRNGPLALLSSTLILKKV